MKTTLTALAGLLVLASSASAQGAQRLVITPATRSVVAGDSVQFSAQLVDESGKQVPESRVTWRSAGFPFEGRIDSTGKFIAGAVGTLPITVIGIVPGAKPVVQRLEIAMVPGPATLVEVSPRPTRLAVGQRVHLSATAFSKAHDRRPDRVTFASDKPSVLRVSNDGAVQALAPGRAVVSATTGAVSEKIPVEVLATPIASVEIQPANAHLRTGDVVHLRAIPRDAQGREIRGLTPSWLFTPGNGLVDEDGAFVAYQPGTYQVTASFGARTGDALVTAVDRDIKRPLTVVGKLIRSAFATSEVWIHPNGNVAYLGTIMGGDRVYAVDISDPAKPTIVDSIVVNARSINDMMTTPDGNTLVITREGAADRKNGIVIADTHDPLHPKLLSEFTSGVTSGVHSAFVHSQPKYGTQVYLTNDGTGALHIVDITDPAHPKQLATWKTPRADAGRMLHDIDVQNGLVYASWWNDGLVILDVGNGIKGGSPSNPQFVSQYKYDLDALYHDVEAEGGKGFIRGTHTAWRYKDYVIIADEVFGNTAAEALYSGGISRAHGRLQVLDVKDIEHPKSVAWYEPEFGGVHNVWVAGDTLYVGAYNAGFKAFDLSGELRGDLKAQGRLIGEMMPADPKGHIANVPFTWGVVVNRKDGIAYVNDFNSGLWAVRIEPKKGAVP
ncbi:MAG TPA: Ig-like domain-containing protein [Gemmatimonadaceae bacterium]